MTPDLITAATEGDVAAVTALLAAGTPVDLPNERGITPLIAAARQNQVEVARLLIEAGADVNRQDNSRQSAYLISTSEGYLELLKLTLANGADVHSLDFFNGTGLIRAADRGHVEIVAELLTTDIAIDHVNRLGWTALLEAIILGNGGERHTEVVRLLVEAGADVNLADGNGVTPLAHAQQRNYAAMAAILVAAGAIASEPLALPTFTPVATAPPPDPLAAFTIAALRERQFSGGTIDRRTLLLETDLYAQYAMAYLSDGLTITGLLYEPAGSGPFPVLILLHGYWPREAYTAGTDTATAAEFFASQGYLVLAPDLRSW
ncbi:MAG: ankyrin repeat domain-containing protein, partial [Ardenticatenales bacterium]|nr:ankyrin repeat domain-containing protein [Ardenticatenales bacterium]